MTEETTLIIEGSKMKALKALLISAVFVILGAVLIMHGQQWEGWACSLFFGLAMPVEVFHLVRGYYLKLDINGFEFHSVIKPWRRKWSDVDSFYVGTINGKKIIGLNFSPSYRKFNTIRKIGSVVSGMEGAISTSFKLSPEEVCEHLNNWKARYG